MSDDKEDLTDIDKIHCVREQFELFKFYFSSYVMKKKALTIWYRILKQRQRFYRTKELSEPLFIDKRWDSTVLIYENKGES